MAQNITLMGATYPDVPAVQLPKAGGGVATFYDVACLKSGVNYIENILCAGYNTGSGNYVDFWVPVLTGGKTPIAASVSEESVVFDAKGGNTFSTAPTITVVGYTDYGVRLELRYPSTKTANIAATVYAINLTITCS